MTLEIPDEVPTKPRDVVAVPRELLRRLADRVWTCDLTDEARELPPAFDELLEVARELVEVTRG